MEDISQNKKFQIEGEVESSPNMYILHVDGSADVPFPFTENDNVSLSKSQGDLSKYVKDNNITVKNKDRFNFFDKVELITEEDLTDKLYEMQIFNLKREPIISFDGFCKAFEDVSKVITYKKDSDPIKNYRHEIERHQLFFHEIFGNNYRMFGLEKDFDFNKLHEPNIGH